MVVDLQQLARNVSTSILNQVVQLVTHIGVHHVHGRVDVVLHEQLTGMGERLADISVVGEDFEVGVYPDVPVSRTTLVVACSTSYHEVSKGKIHLDDFCGLAWEDGLELDDPVSIRDLSAPQPSLSIVISGVSS